MTDTIAPWEELESIIDRADAEALGAALERMSAGESARAMSRLSAEQQTSVLTMLDPGAAADLIEEIPEPQAADILSNMDASPAAAIVAELPSGAGADLLTALDDHRAEAILAELPADAASGLRELASYPADVAGGLMVTEFLSYPDTATVADVVRDMRDRADTLSDYQVQYVYATGDDGRLVGVLPLRDLLVTPGKRPVAGMMIRDPLTVGVQTPLDELGDFFERYAFVGVPVVDPAGRLAGVVQRRDVREALGDRARSDHLKSQGIVGGEELRSMPVLRRSRRRLSWLTINVALNIVAASVIAFYQDTLSAVIALAVFLPIISDMSGCSGNQAVAVSMRELALGVAKPRDIFYVWSREAIVGVINGMVLGLLLAGAAYLWKGNGYLGLVVGAALAANTVVAVSLGGTVPLLLRRFGMDPALASGPILTTVTDMCGFFMVLSLASLLLEQLTI